MSVHPELYIQRGGNVTVLQALQQENWQDFVRVYNGAGVGTALNKDYVDRILAGKLAYERNTTRI